MNLFTKSVATVSGIVFAAVFFVIFTISERQNQRRHALTARQMRSTSSSSTRTPSAAKRCRSVPAASWSPCAMPPTRSR